MNDYVEIVGTGKRHLDGCMGRRCTEIAPGCFVVRLTDGREVTIDASHLRTIRQE
jgi:hypothetical protein